ncbi:alpha/beta fold hydrolase [Glaciecola petra]|uniref:Alpha/beta fold hydrolase n=1 Tax=Glaciecola petra TaxID=3075602 RepID=A0ABU2ZQJ0_9ALTE|nr:alpha/beta fold hydrolase [Aestuariibacter sp. P117]MDT0594887.1 alpha/beta fold hydrolase [Aestuariibacter sp. P117]
MVATLAKINKADLTINKPLLFIFLSFLILTGCDEERALAPIAFNKANTLQLQYKCPDVLPNIGGDLCGLYSVPLNWLSPKADKINVFLRAFPLPKTDKNESNGQLWLLDGGPGASGATFSDPKFVDLVHGMGWDLFIPTHRGVGFSNHLNCNINYQPLDEMFVQICAPELINAYSDNLDWFGAVGAAHDLDYLIRANNPNKVPVVVMGTSYGTFLTQRFIQLFEGTIDAAVLMSGISLEPKFEITANEQEKTLKRMLLKCDEMPKCAALFETSAYQTATDLIVNDAWQMCEFTKTNPQSVSFIIGSLASNSALRKDLPLTIKRLNNCDKQDIVKLQKTLTLIQKNQQRQNKQLFQFNPLMLHHQIFTELLSKHTSKRKQALLPQNPLLMSIVETYINLQHAWPTQAPPISLPNTLKTKLPILVMHGGLDMQAPLQWFEEIEQQLTRANQHAILFPDAGHGTPNYTKLANEENCSWKIVESFMENRNEQLNTECLHDVKPITFAVE